MSETTKSYAAPEQLWRVNDHKANKAGPHRSVYWVERRQADEDGKVRGEKWLQGARYVGDWQGNLKEGFGVMYYVNGMKYEGQWTRNLRHGLLYMGELSASWPKSLAPQDGPHQSTLKSYHIRRRENPFVT
jgi:hypothetical protein